MNEYGKCDVGQAVITPSFGLEKQQIKRIIHTVGPQNGDASMLASCYRNSLNLIINKPDLKTIAFPCISTAIYGFDNHYAAHIALKTVKDWLQMNHSHLKQIVFCTYLDKDYQIYKDIIKQFFPEHFSE